MSFRVARRGRRAQSIIETIVGIIFMIPIVLFLFDIGILILANTQNDHLAKQAARAAASATPRAVAGESIQYGNIDCAVIAATGIINAHRIGGYVRSVRFAYIGYHRDNKPIDTRTPQGPTPTDANAVADPGQGNVAIVTAMQVTAPVPFPGFDPQRTFIARAVEPIVSVQPAD